MTFVGRRWSEASILTIPVYTYIVELDAFAHVYVFLDIYTDIYVRYPYMYVILCFVRRIQVEQIEVHSR